MKKLMFIAIICVSCNKKECIRCERGSEVFEGCKGENLHEETNMAELFDLFQSNGYECEIDG